MSAQIATLHAERSEDDAVESRELDLREWSIALLVVGVALVCIAVALLAGVAWALGVAGAAAIYGGYTISTHVEPERSEAVER